MTAEEATHLTEVRVRLDSAATLASQGMLGQVDGSDALKGVLRLVEKCRLHLKAIGQ